MSLRDFVLDTWAPLSYKSPFRGQQGVGTALISKTWMSEQDRRRLTAYLVLESYDRNRAAKLIELDGDVKSANERREYGDASLLNREALAALLGREQTIVVDQADQFDPDMGEAEDPEGSAEDAPVEPSDGPTADELAANAEAGRASERQQWLRDWADAEKFATKMHQAERDATRLGDGIYLLAFSGDKKRVRLTTLDPGFYFPVLPDQLFDDFPERVHFAWEIEADNQGNPKKIRRLTYELGAIRPETETIGPLARLRRVLRTDPTSGLPQLQAGDQYDVQTGKIARKYPWQAADDEPSLVTCYMTDATWLIEDAKQLVDLDPSKATYAVNADGQVVEGLDLHIDFLPIVHVPNTPAGASHFGEAVISRVLQILDDIAGGDTDEQKASATTGLPIIGVTGEQGDDKTVKPGGVWFLGEGGRLDSVDTSAGLTALGEANKARRDLLSVNSRLPAAFLGRVTPAEVPSGFALALGFAPLDSFVDEGRLVRTDKYPLLFTMVQKLAMAANVLEHGVPLRATLEFGSYLPANVQEVITQVTALRAAQPEPLISMETAIGMLINVGVPIDDAAAEIAKIEQRDLESANQLADATGNTDLVHERLGLEPPTLTPPPLPRPLPGPPEPPEPQPAG